MYQALYRKWRPRSFDDVAGQEHVTETLRRQVATGRLSHAYLLVGTRGTGKTTCAKILSRAVNCERPVNGSPCNECPSCVGIEDGSILDVLELDAASNNGVDNVRALREEAVFTPAAVKRRVYIIDEVHMLSPAAFNALLKIMEEPPEHLLFILATTELHKVPATILSRCQRFSFGRLAPEVIAKRLSYVADSEGLTLTDEAAARLARLGDGSMRDALSLLDQCASADVIDLDKVLTTIGLASGDETVRLVSAVLERDAAASLGILAKLYESGKDMQSALSDASVLIRDVLLKKLAPNGGDRLQSGAHSDKIISELSGKSEAERLFFCLDTMGNSLATLSRGASARLAAELCILRMCDERLMGGDTALLSRISRLEAMYSEPPPTRAVPRAAQTVSEPAAPKESEKPDIPDDEPPWEFEPYEEAEPEYHPIETAPEPEPEPMREPPRSDVPGDFWEQILDALRGEAQIHALLSDAQVSAELDGAKLTIRAGNSFTASSIESKAFMEPIKRTAEAALGRAVTIAVAKDSGAVKAEPSALDRLGAFDIVKFE